MEKTNLGKKGFWYYIGIIFLSPLWLINANPIRKSWSEFKGGLISHKCEWSEKLEYDSKYKWHYRSCIHHGCFVINPEIAEI